MEDVIWLVYTGPKKAKRIENTLNSRWGREITVLKGEPFPISSLMKNWFLSSGSPFQKVSVGADVFEKWFEKAPEVGESRAFSSRKDIRRAFHPERKFKILFMTADDPGYSGARYSDYALVQALAKTGAHIHVCTPKESPFMNDWKREIGISFEFNNRYAIKYAGFDLVIGTPPQCLKRAIEYGEFFQIPIWLFCYETDKWLTEEVPEWKDKIVDHREEYLQADAILCSSKMTKEKFYEWDKRFNRIPIHICEPPLNLEVMKSVLKQKIENEITYIGRIADFKGWKEIGKAIIEMKDPLDLNYIGTGTSKVREVFGNGNNLHKFNYYERVDDKTKFQIIQRSKAGIVLSRHEGFGMVPAEFLAFNKPFVALELKQLKREYGDDLIYVKNQKNLKEIQESIQIAVSGKKKIRNFKLEKFSLDVLAEKIKKFLPKPTRHKIFNEMSKSSKVNLTFEGKSLKDKLSFLYMTQTIKEKFSGYNIHIAS